jgi:hypothetical protein
MARDPENTLILELKTGPVAIALRPDLAPGHVARIKELTRKGFYDGVVLHRVIPGFMAQTGDPTGTGAGGSDLPDLKAEFTTEKHKRGTVSAARTGNIRSGAKWWRAWTMSTPSRRAASTITAPSPANPTRSSKPASKRINSGLKAAQ